MLTIVQTADPNERISTNVYLTCLLYRSYSKIFWCPQKQNLVRIMSQIF